MRKINTPIILNTYWVYPDGTIVNINTLKQVRAYASVKSRSGKKYWRVGLYEFGVRKYFLLHRLVAQCYLGDIPKGYEVNHIDRNPSNNCYLNLEIVTPKENSNAWRNN